MEREEGQGGGSLGVSYRFRGDLRERKVCAPMEQRGKDGSSALEGASRGTRETRIIEGGTPDHHSTPGKKLSPSFRVQGMKRTPAVRAVSCGDLVIIENTSTLQPKGKGGGEKGVSATVCLRGMDLCFGGEGFVLFRGGSGAESGNERLISYKRVFNSVPQ